jgi:Secretion system C-terminal sorting domain
VRYKFTMRPRIFIACFLVFFSSAASRASWSNFGSYNAADFYNAHLGLVGVSGSGGLIDRYADGILTEVFITPVIQIAIQDSNRAWATDGDSLYLGTNGWTSWRTVLGQQPITLVRATPGALFVYSDSNLYRTVGDTALAMVQGIFYNDSITAMDYLSDSCLIAVSSSNIYRSTDGGATWTRVLTKMKKSASVFVDTAHHLVFTGGDNLRVSADSGQTWTVVVPPLEFGIISLIGQVFGARDCSGALYVANGTVSGSNSDIMRSQDDGISFEDIGQNPFPPSNGSSVKGWAFDRGSTMMLGYAEYPGSALDLSITHNGGDDLIPDSVASAITVSADTIYDTICAVASVPFNVSVASAICTGVQIDAISVVKSKGTLLKNIKPQILFGNEVAFSLSYSGTVPGIDSIVLRISFHSVEWGFEEHVDVPVIAYSVSPPAALTVTDSLQFGDVAIMTSKKLEFRIANSGCSALRVDSIVSSNSEIFSLPTIRFPFNIKSDSGVKITVTFSPVRVGPSLESIELGTNAGHTFIELEGQAISLAAVSDGESDVKTDFSIVPNPASAMITILGVSEDSKYEIMDLLGRNVQSGIVAGQSIFIVSLPDGIYVLRCAGQHTRFVISGK